MNIASVYRENLSDRSQAWNVLIYEGRAVCCKIGASSEPEAKIIADAINNGAAWAQGVK